MDATSVHPVSKNRPCIREARIKWVDNMRFVGTTPSGHSVLMDATSVHPVSKNRPCIRDTSGAGNTAGTPMELILLALGGCTGMDVVSILQKMQVDFKSVEIVVKGERANEHPRVYKKIELVYKIQGNNIPENKVKKAVELSQGKYCSVSAMLKTSVKIDYLIEH